MGRRLSVAEERALAVLAKDAATRLRRGLRASDPGTRGVAYRETAEVLVEARSHFLTDAGAVDWRGQSYPYRLWVGDVYGLAGVAPEDRARVSSALRYHVSNALRSRLDPAALADLGLLQESARERSKAQREAKSAVLRSLQGSPVSLAGSDAVRALTAAEALLERVEPEGLPPEGVARLNAVSRLVSRLRRSVSAAGR